MSLADQHRSLTTEYWSRFTRDQQLLMIGNEMNRAAKSLATGDLELASGELARALLLTDLTAATSGPLRFRRELLRFRELLAAHLDSPSPDARLHGELFYALLCLTPATFLQVPHVTGLPPHSVS